MPYRIDMNSPTIPIPCTFVASSVPGKMICVNEDGTALVVNPDGTERVNPEPPGQNWDSAWTQFESLSGLAVYRSPGGPTAPKPEQILGVPRAYRMVA